MIAGLALENAFFKEPMTVRWVNRHLARGISFSGLAQLVCLSLHPRQGGFPAGSSPDFVARLLAEHLEDYASTILVDNRPGAGGRLPFVMVLTPGDQIALFPMSTPSFATTAGTRPRLAAAPMRRARP